MLTEKGVIEKILDQNALVRIQRSSACAHCESRGKCEVTSDNAVLIEVANDHRAKVGDHVELNMPANNLMKLSLLVYLLPIIALIIGAYVGGILAESLQIKHSIASILGGGFAMGIAFCLLKYINRAAKARSNYHPRMTRTLFRVSAEPPPP